MVNTLENIELTKECISIENNQDGKLILYSNLLTSLFLLIFTYKRLDFTNLDVLTIITGSVAIVLLLLNVISVFRISFQKEIGLSEIAYVKDKTSLTGHRSLILRLKNKKIRNLYLEPSDIPEMLSKLTQHNIPIKANRKLSN